MGNVILKRGYDLRLWDLRWGKKSTSWAGHRSADMQGQLYATRKSSHPHRPRIRINNSASILSIRQTLHLYPYIANI